MKLRTRLIAAFVAATIIPVALTWWTSLALLERSLELTPARELDDLSKSLEKTAQKLYQRARAALKEDALSGKIAAVRYEDSARTKWPPDIEEFYLGGQMESFSLAENGTDITYLKRADPNGRTLLQYAAPIGDINFKQIREQYSQARARLGQTRDRNVHRAFTYAFAAIASVIWLATLGALIWWTGRLSRPVQRLTDALHRVAGGDLSTRVADPERDDEIGVAIRAFNEMAERVEQSREKLVYVTRLASWQALARKMAHEVKNSLTPIRLTMEEIASRYASRNDGFIDQASQIVAEEVTALEKRVRAFTELASEPPVTLAEWDLNSLIEERIAFLRKSHPEVRYETRLAVEQAPVKADSDLVRGVLTNLLENALEWAPANGVIEVGAIARENELEAWVENDGPAIPPVDLERVFDTFWTRRARGSGLGLAICKRVIEAHGGTIRAENRRRGPRFTFTLPLAKVTAKT